MCDQGVRRVLKAVYLAAALLPAALLVITGEMAHIGPYHIAARFFAVTGFAMLLLQPVLSARLRWVERPFGLDGNLRFHRVAGLTAGVFAVLHPVFLSLGNGSFGLLTRLDTPWQINAGKLTMVFILLYGGAALFRAGLKIPFQLWLRMHNAGAPVIITGAFLHSWFTAVQYMHPSLRAFWFGLGGLSLFSYLHLTVYQRLSARRNSLEITEVNRITASSWEIVMGKKPFSYLPGQFLFLTPLRGRGLPVEEHPFTISSSPMREGSISVTVKESGDFTASIGDTKPGDRAAVAGPYGRFSYVLHPDDRKIVFIAGGIGITPILSMLRHMTARPAGEEAWLFYANRTPGDIAYREELDAMAADPASPLKRTVNILSSPDDGWTGERGRLSADILNRYVEGLQGCACYICGPPPMMNAVAAILLEAGVDPGNIRMERFAL